MTTINNRLVLDIDGFPADAVAGLLTEPLGRPKTSGREGNLRSEFRRGRETAETAAGASTTIAAGKG